MKGLTGSSCRCSPTTSTSWTRTPQASGRVMALALHPLVIGRPNRQIAPRPGPSPISPSRPRTWLTTSDDIAEHYAPTTAARRREVPAGAACRRQARAPNEASMPGDCGARLLKFTSRLSAELLAPWPCCAETGLPGGAPIPASPPGGRAAAAWLARYARDGAGGRGQAANRSRSRTTAHRGRDRSGREHAVARPRSRRSPASAKSRSVRPGSSRRAKRRHVPRWCTGPGPPRCPRSRAARPGLASAHTLAPDHVLQVQDQPDSISTGWRALAK